MNKNQKGTNNPNFRHGRCIDTRCINCNKKIHPQATRCRPCENKHHAESMKDNKNSNFGKKLSDKIKRKISLSKGGTGTPYATQKTTCIDCKSIIWRGSIRCSKCSDKFQKNENHPRFGHLMKPNWEVYDGIWMRSSWEVAYAKYLDKNHTKWLYEPKTFDLGKTTYTPDFYLPETDEYIEIKGYESDLFNNKIRIFYLKNKYIKLEIIDKIKLLSLKLINKRGITILEE